jgi:hypothetical protein
MNKIFAIVLSVLSGISILSAPDLQAEEGKPFVIQIQDGATGRGVPLVELETVNHIRFVSDSAGRVAIDDADLLRQTVHFSVFSHGYSFPKDGFGILGTSFFLEPGGKGVIELQRNNLAERLYRVTGSGLYRDSVQAGETLPLAESSRSGKVVGCDSVLTAFYRGKLYWFWGDTSIASYPLGGSFHMTGATTSLPGASSWSPSETVPLEYLVDEKGVAKPLAKMSGEGPTWVTGVTVLKDSDGQERLYGSYVKIRNLLESYRWGFVVWNDERQEFDHVISFDERPFLFVEPQSHTLIHRDKAGQDFIYFCTPFPTIRVLAAPEKFLDPTQYEVWTCLKPGTRVQEGQVDRDGEGKVRFTWQKNMEPLTQKLQSQLIESGKLQKDEASLALRGYQNNKPVQAHFGSTFWNEYRQRWVSIFTEEGGESSLLGEVWYAESEELTGPWKQAIKIVSHQDYTFYNPRQHPEFSEQGGRVIYFEGTYTHTFSGTKVATPRYDYNQVMYRLDLNEVVTRMRSSQDAVSQGDEKSD